jgi:hypothetical protein
LLTDNESTVQSSSLERTSLKARHVALSYHRVREAAAAGIVGIGWIATHLNTADYGTKPLDKFKFREHTGFMSRGEVTAEAVEVAMSMVDHGPIMDTDMTISLSNVRSDISDNSFVYPDVRSAYAHINCDEHGVW